MLKPPGTGKLALGQRASGHPDNELADELANRGVAELSGS